MHTMLSQALTAVVLLAASVVAQGTQGLPGCATSCISGYGGCNQVDVECICTNQDLLQQLSCCVSQKCSADEITEVLQFANALCGSYGVTSLPQTASCASASSTAATSGSASSSASASASSSGTATSSPASASASATSSATGTETSASASATVESSASAAATESGSSAGKSYQVEGMGIGMAILGLLAAL